MGRIGFMKGTWLAIALCAGGMLAVEPADARQVYNLSDGLSVMPRLLEGKESYEVAELIEALMQPKGGSDSFPWDTLANSGIVWSPDGISYVDGAAVRNGLVRVNVLGTVSTILRSRVEEIFWRIGLAGLQSPNVEADVIAIEPGGVGDFSCFGIGSTSCSFDIEESLEAIGLDYDKERLCSVSSQRGLDLYTIRKAGYRNMYVAQETDAGSGGAKTTLSMTMYDEAIADLREGCD